MTSTLQLSSKRRRKLPEITDSWLLASVPKSTGMFSNKSISAKAILSGKITEMARIVGVREIVLSMAKERVNEFKKTPGIEFLPSLKDICSYRINGVTVHLKSV